jgi:protein MpaA
VLYTGAIHGDEQSASYILNDWINDLEANAKNIAANRQIVIVPTVNPDGLSAGTRNNANNVNLNRNFATNDWKQDINDTNGTVKNGGGTSPMSEPETQAIANLSSQLRPRLVLSYHAVGSVAIGNEAGDSASLAAKYASLVGYNNGTGNSAEIFSYEISGTYDDWLAQKLGSPSIIIELGSYSYRNFSHHRQAFWAMANS